MPVQKIKREPVIVHDESSSSAARMMMDDEENDEIVREIDVYLAPALSQQIYLLQYPLHTSAPPAPTAARIKPRHGTIELDHPIPTDIERQGLFGMKDRTFQSHTIPVKTHMCLGKLEMDASGGGGKSRLHLVPLIHVNQMRPVFRHVDDTTQPSTSAQDEEAAAAASKEAERKPLLFQRKESERAAMARKSSYAYKRSSEESESWQDLQVYDVHSNKHKMYAAQAICKDFENLIVAPPKDPTMDPHKAYVQTLDYMPIQLTTMAPLVEASDPKSIVTRLVTLMIRGTPMPYSILRARFDNTVSDEQILAGLATVAVMVRGNYALQSCHVSLPDGLQKVRTFILFILQRDGFVERRKVERAFAFDARVSPQRVLILLQQVGKKVTRGWILKVDPDERFERLHPEQCRKNDVYWERKGVQFEDILTVYQLP
jgi:DNA-directed RNA polymerase III subunit RPC5